MYKVFLADDEIVVREGIRSNFPWEDTDFVLAGEAPDGEMALSMLQDIKPDILITDIRMPFMDGLELCRTVSATMPWMYIVILSGYDDFTYAKEAISLGVKEYLLKPVSGEELLQVLNRIAERIREDKRQQASMRAFRDQLASSGRLLKEKLLSDLVSGGNLPELMAQARNLQMGLVAHLYQCIVVDPAKEGVSTEELNDMQGVLCRLSDSSGGSVLLCQLQGRFVLLVMGDDSRDLEERTYGLAQAVQYDVERNTVLKPVLAIGTAVEQLERVPDSYLNAKSLLGKRDEGSGSNRRIVDAQDEEAESGGEGKSLPLNAVNASPIYAQLRLCSRDDVDGLLNQYVESFGENAARSKLVASYILVDVVLAASRVIRDHGGDPQEIIPDALKIRGLESTCSLEKALPLARDAMERALVFRDRQTATKYSRVIWQAKSYIQEHSSNPDLTLHDVADSVALSNNHFCTVFSQETGVTFTEYLTGVRLAKARELLMDSTLRTSDVAFQVGYNDPHYFSYLFKKTVGLSPRDYRKECGGRSDEG